MSQSARSSSSRLELSLLAILFILLSVVVLTADDRTVLKPGWNMISAAMAAADNEAQFAAVLVHVS